MGLVLGGLVAAMAEGREDQTHKGRVWLADDGTVAAVTRAGQAEPPGFTTALRIDVGRDVIYPGLVDLHSHLGYNTMPLWADPGQTTAYLHHDIWPGEDTYKPQLSWPAWALAEFAPESMLAYVQVRALAGGTTAIQGWPSASRPATNMLVRSVDNDAVGPLSDPVRVSSLTMKREDLRVRATNLRDGRIFIYHCAEGQPGSIVTREFDDLEATGCLQEGLVATHTCALDATHYQRWRAAVAPPAGRPAGTIVWSPFSNLWLYGVTTDVPAAQDAGLTVCLGTDWGPSGTRNLLGELKVARQHSDTQGWGLTDHDLVRMVTCAPGDALGRAWQVPVGRLVPGALGDVVVLAGRTDDPWTNLVTAREQDIQLVIVGGQPRWGTTALLKGAGVAASATTAVPMGRARRRVRLVRPDDPTRTWTWTDVRARLNAVRASVAGQPPVGPAGGRSGGTSGGAAPKRASDVGDPPGTPPMVVKLDMPGGPQASAGPPPQGQTVQIPPIEPVFHNVTWLRTIRGRGFHGGALDTLAAAFQ
ncbi:MAG: amidohydrolase family protein [Actinomycetota bacterium]|nr:amidohydrolase family protein [Actinomycetota bacterium]